MQIYFLWRYLLTLYRVFFSLIGLWEFNKKICQISKRKPKKTWNIIVFQEAVLYACTLLGPLATVAYEELIDEQNKKPGIY